MTLVLIVVGALVVVNLASIAVAWFRISVTRPTLIDDTGTSVGLVTLIRPVRGLDEYDAHALASTFVLSYPDVEIVFCAADSDDPAVALVERLMLEYRDAMVTEPQLLVGESGDWSNPKLRNLAKGWDAATGRWVVMADSNVVLPTDAVQHLLRQWSRNTGLVCSPPLGSRPRGFWAEVECSFLNTYQARWQFVADALGIGFAQGKVMLWNRGMLNSWGGPRVLASDLAEDAAATKAVRRAGLRVRLVDAPFPQPLGHRTFGEVLARQTRWAVLRRKTFPALFAAELASTLVLPIVMILAHPGILAIAAALSATAAWYGAECALAWSKGWHVSWRYPIAMAARDLLIPWIYAAAWLRDDFAWRGHDMTVKK